MERAKRSARIHEPMFRVDIVIEQIGVGVLGAIAVYLSQDRRTSRQRYACLFGLASQPFWFYMTYKAGQWGIMPLNAIYTYAYLCGFKNYWLAGDGK